MKEKRFSILLYMSILFLFILPGCGKEQKTSTETQPILPTIKSPTEIPSLTATISESTPTQPAMPIGPDVTWRLVVVSEASGWGLGTAFANQIQKDLGVKVVLDDFAFDNLTTLDVLEVLKNGTSSIPGLSGLPEAIKNADVILLTPGPVYASNLATLVTIQRCFGAASGVPDPCAPNAFDSYTTDLEAIWTKIFELRAGKPTILRGLDAATPLVRVWIANGTHEACTTCWESYSAAARKASNKFGIPFFSRYDVFNGKDHRTDPFIMGYVRGDGIHPNDSAQIYTSQLLAELGYEPINIP
jgi:hypothetical protein